MPAACEESDSWTCAAVYDWTGNETLAQGADLADRQAARDPGDRPRGRPRPLGRWRRRSTGSCAARSSRPCPATGTPSTGGRSGPRASGPCSRASPPRWSSRIAFVMVLSELGINVAPILASAGVLGLAIGFGAQNLVKDYLSGVMMMIEDQYGVGDAVDLGEAIGTVENVGLRVTRRARRGRHRLVRPQRRDPARRQPEPELGPHRARRERRLRRGPGPGARGAPGRRPRAVGGRGLQGRHHRGARGLGRRRASPRTGSSSASRSRPPRWSSGRRARDARSGSSRASTTRASRCRSRSACSGSRVPASRFRPAGPRPGSS